MTRTTPQLATLSTPSCGHLAHLDINVYWTCLQGGSSVELDFEPATLRPRGGDLTTRPPASKKLKLLRLSKIGKEGKSGDSTLSNPN
ncbi:hypothetical protein AVEN_124713-1 [Araneus ventricosus]|uniref:Uncharacterized protein n=1 Tax=Araneus ventricosus TaxID=182803 RepID=A0A4Y2UBT6_ARAVE|nr:hypothetical protein AVEN_124713-1 [Araneus ventricosus]